MIFMEKFPFSSLWVFKLTAAYTLLSLDLSDLKGIKDPLTLTIISPTRGTYSMGT
jgi:hypothetical protein